MFIYYLFNRHVYFCHHDLLDDGDGDGEERFTTALVVLSRTYHDSNPISQVVQYFSYTTVGRTTDNMQVRLEEGTSFEDGTRKFERIPDCFLGIGLGYIYDILNII